MSAAAAEAKPTETPRPRSARPTTLRFEGGSRTMTQAVDAPAPADPARRAALERELDRVQAAVASEQTTFGQQLNWLMLSQALFLNAYLIVLVLGWNSPLPGKRWLLAGLAALAVAVALFIHLALRGARDGLQQLKAKRREIEAALEREFGRAPVFYPRNTALRALAGASTRMLPATFVAGWAALALYTLGVPIKASEEAQAAAAGARPAARPTARAAPPTPAPVPVAHDPTAPPPIQEPASPRRSPPYRP
jgi:hypothetical protein